jgi:chromate reductase, NAD(P)H dehydrogenase (quinone)
MTTIIGLAGSMRRESWNVRLLRAAASVAPAGVRVKIESLRDIPLYDGDLEREHGVPPTVERLKDRIAASDALLLATPEYNNSLPGTFKNAIDWLTRPPRDIARVFGERPVALIGATPGAGGTRFAQAAWLPVLRTLGTRPWFGAQLYVARAPEAFDESGELSDPELRERLTRFMAGFAAFVRHTAEKDRPH